MWFWISYQFRNTLPFLVPTVKHTFSLFRQFSNMIRSTRPCSLWSLPISRLKKYIMLQLFLFLYSDADQTLSHSLTWR
jgi:hypothetical protein